MKTKFNIRYGIVSYDPNYVSETVYEKKAEFKGSELAAKSKATRLMNADPEMDRVSIHCSMVQMGRLGRS